MEEQKYTVYQAYPRKSKEDMKKFKKLELPIDQLSLLLKYDLGVHEYIQSDSNYKLVIDLDSICENTTLEKIISNICEFLNIKNDDVVYTTNFNKKGSHHIVIPKFYLKGYEQADLWKRFKKTYNYTNGIDEKIYNENSKCGGFLRLPNQIKCYMKEGTEHIIQKGTIKDFILNYIPENCKKYNLSI